MVRLGLESVDPGTPEATGCILESRLIGVDSPFYPAGVQLLGKPQQPVSTYLQLIKEGEKRVASPIGF